MGDHVRRQEWWKTSKRKLIEEGGHRAITRAVWNRAEAVQARADEEYSVFANVFMDFLGGHLNMAWNMTQKKPVKQPLKW